MARWPSTPPLTWRGLVGGSTGSFSRDRCKALQLYQQRTSISRCLVVSLVTPLPALAYTIAIEALLPLAPITDGWDASPNLTIRVFVITCSTAFCGMILMRGFIPELCITRRQLCLPVLVSSSLHTASAVVIVTLWVFPMPFMATLTAGLFTLYCGVSMRIFIGIQPFRAVPDIDQKLIMYIAHVSLLLALIIAYPAYGAFYRSLHGDVQTACIALPILGKYLAKKLVVKHVRALQSDDVVPVIVQFTVELAHALFITTCMQTTSNPTKVVILIVLFDYIPLAFAYFDLRGRFSHVRRVRPSIRVHSSSSPVMLSQSTNKPVSHILVRQNSRVGLQGLSAASDRTCQALYACENHLLMEYIECVIPCVYGVYVAVLFYLPNAHYYDTMDSMQTSSSLVRFLASIGVLLALQIASVVGFSVMLSRRVLPSVSSLHQLSFVLETQAEMIQCWLLSWVPFCILATVQHGGMDFTLRFEWMHRNSTQV